MQRRNKKFSTYKTIWLLYYHIAVKIKTKSQDRGWGWEQKLQEKKTNKLFFCLKEFLRWYALWINMNFWWMLTAMPYHIHQSNAATFDEVYLVIYGG